MPAIRITVVSSLLLATAAITSASAQGAPTVTFDQSCYTTGESITQAGGGFSPKAQVAEFVGFSSNDNSTLLGNLSGPIVVADATGAFTRRLDAPPLRRVSDRRENAVSSFTDQASPYLRFRSVDAVGMGRAR
jgi:hypothetical protein